MTNALALICLAGVPLNSPQCDLFSPNEEMAIQAFWSAPGTYEQVDAVPNNPFQVIPSSAGSEWLYHYYIKREPNVLIKPTENPKPKTLQHKQWDQWIEFEYQADFAKANRQAAKANDAEKGRYGPWLDLKSAKETPDSLQKLAGTPPSFATVKRVKIHKFALPGFQTTLTDSASLRPLYPYLREELGTNYTGRTVSTAQFNRLANLAGISNKEKRVFAAVSSLEGSFSSLNTYDTGVVSVGFIQFASLKNGAGSLGRLLLKTKKNHPQDFDNHFRKFGVDVTPDAILVVFDTVQNAELMGTDAAQAIVHNKRLSAVFIRAGELFDGYKVEQIKLAKESYYPASKAIQVVLGGKTHSVQVQDFIKTDQGMAMLMDRMVNTGGLGNLNKIVQASITELGITSVSQLTKIENHLIGDISHRNDMVALSTNNNYSPRPDSMSGSLSGQGNFVSAFDPSGLVGLPAPGEPITLNPPTHGDKTESTGPTTAETPGDPSKAESNKGQATQPETTKTKPRDVKKTSGPITDVGG